MLPAGLFSLKSESQAQVEQLPRPNAERRCMDVTTRFRACPGSVVQTLDVVWHGPEPLSHVAIEDHFYENFTSVQQWQVRPPPQNIPH